MSDTLKINSMADLMEAAANKILKISSIAEAEAYWTEMYDHPEYWDSGSNLNDVEEALEAYETEFDELQREAKRMGENMNNYKMNRLISLSFVVKAGKTYLEKASVAMYDNKIPIADFVFEEIERQYGKQFDPRFFEE